jgi:hypothetical protein
MKKSVFSVIAVFSKAVFHSENRRKVLNKQIREGIQVE